MLRYESVDGSGGKHEQGGHFHPMDANMGDFAEKHKLSRYLYICNRAEVAQARDIKSI